MDKKDLKILLICNDDVVAGLYPSDVTIVKIGKAAFWESKKGRMRLDLDHVVDFKFNRIENYFDVTKSTLEDANQLVFYCKGYRVEFYTEF